jgi:hypothetical protein
LTAIKILSMKMALLTQEYPHARTGNSGGIGASIKEIWPRTFTE